MLVATLERTGSILAFSPDGRILVVASGTHLEFWDVSTVARTAHWDDEDLQARGFGRHARSNQAAFSPDGRFLAVAGRRLVVLDAATYENVASFDAEQDADFTDAAFLPSLLVGVLAGFEFASDASALSFLLVLLPFSLLVHGVTAYRFARRDTMNQSAETFDLLHNKAFWRFLVVVLAANVLYLTLAYGTVACLGGIG